MQVKETEILLTLQGVVMTHTSQDQWRVSQNQKKLLLQTVKRQTNYS